MPTMREIMIEVATKHQLRIDDIRARSKTPRLLRARQEFCYRALRETGRTPAEIGMFVRREHSTVLWAAARYGRQHQMPAPRGKDLFPNSYRWGHWRTWPYHRRLMQEKTMAGFLVDERATA